MNITVFLASRNGNNPKFQEVTNEIGKEIGKRGHHLIFGGTNTGLMKVLCDSFLTESENVTAVEPDIEFIKNNVNPGVKDVIYADSLNERKDIMIYKADAFIILPGGPGSLGEYGEIFELLKLEKINQKIVFVNIDGFYDPFRKLLENMEKEDFLGVSSDHYLFSDNIDEIFGFIE